MKNKTKKLLTAIFMFAACLICLVGLSYSWFSGVGYRGYGGTYEKNLIIGGTNSGIENYIGTITNNGTATITYTLVDAQNSFNVDNLYPGARQYFKTKVTNTYENAMSYSIFISQILCDSPLKDFISIKATSPSPRTTSLANMQYTDQGSDVYAFKSIQLSDKYTVSSGNYFEIYWYVEVSEGAGNDCMGKGLTIESIGIGN